MPADAPFYSRLSIRETLTAGADISVTAFASKPEADQLPGRLVVRRIPELNPKRNLDQPRLLGLYRFHAVFTTADPGLLDTVATDKITGST